MYERILVPTDGSPESERAVEEALDLAALADATVVALYVVDTSDYESLPEAKWAALRSELESEGERAVEAVAERANEAGVDAETVVADGTPHEVILERAKSGDVDAVAMGTHGRSGVERFLLGSVTERVVRESPVPVLVARVAESA
ncbi:universal stress protein [Halarchaeum sp. CBA1220]|uniref:universal stress protein n=1 Tax=Halarchaeum sp. CBA1220 TaxID=1853682 RepID=UPI000F3A94F1|nr:universal stress protein [Halarchaeum sp. CBA1220]QLC33041.1 universal stress protein [Halarchaeum sp. CBA1220]